MRMQGALLVLVGCPLGRTREIEALQMVGALGQCRGESP
jgi:hypothetical protein